MSDAKTQTRSRLKGVVISDKMQETAVVLVERLVKHPKYDKRYKQSKKYKAHNPENTFKTGEKVMIESCRPMSKDKCWRIVDRLTAGE